MQLAISQAVNLAAVSFKDDRGLVGIAVLEIAIEAVV